MCRLRMGISRVIWIRRGFKGPVFLGRWLRGFEMGTDYLSSLLDFSGMEVCPRCAPASAGRGTGGECLESANLAKWNSKF